MRSDWGRLMFYSEALSTEVQTSESMVEIQRAGSLTVPNLLHEIALSVMRHFPQTWPEAGMFWNNMCQVISACIYGIGQTGRTLRERGCRYSHIV